ncbi:hypothetical protein ACFS2C_11840 [Prauserella oleivorans]|uniref:Uncharacterized protein n=1 Tax=Prauserella oleivorans TaxID=1478153 RepID=A0ABW5W7Y3_9PSEU
MTDLVAAVLVAALIYGTSLAIWPYTACGRCSGAGKRRSPSGKAWRPCPRCGGTGRKERLGRRLLR